MKNKIMAAPDFMPVKKKKSALGGTIGVFQISCYGVIETQPMVVLHHINFFLNKKNETALVSLMQYYASTVPL
jgi:hypothetical protein